MRYFTPPRDLLRSAARTPPVHHRLLHLLAALISARMNTDALHVSFSKTGESEAPLLCVISIS